MTKLWRHTSPSNLPILTQYGREALMSVESILSERQAIYGDYEDVAATSQAIKRAMRMGASYAELNDQQLESLDMIANKLARIVNGKAHADNWLDLSGYSELALRSGE